MKKTIVSKVAKAIELLTSLKWLSNIDPAKAVITMVVTIINKAFGICFFRLISAPCLLKNLLSEKLTPLNFLVNSGTPSIVSQNIMAAEYGKAFWDGLSPIIQNTIVRPKVIPRANIRFQRLSLFNLAWKKPSCGASDVIGVALVIFLRLLQKLAKSVKSSPIVCIHSWLYQIYTVIISKLHHNTKKIIPLTLVISLGMCANSANAFAPKSLQEIFADAEAKYDIPDGLLVSIARVESAINPYALNVNGKAVNARTNDEARELIHVALRAGINNIDIGIMQLNYRWHQGEFQSIDEMLSVERNIAYAASFLSKLKSKHGNWHTALRHYHSANPEHYRKYSRKVVMCWLGN